MGALLLVFELESACQANRKRVRGAPRAVGIRPNGSPASHTLIVLSQEPETIVFPSGEKSTQVIRLLCAFSLLAFSSRVPENHTERASEATKWQLEFDPTADLRPTH